ncbi:Lrp/AsnC family transcriptional regulator [Endozoicomonas lisbonensis]|uniref:DNA-binding Lrp family transcriptional regulator n=1 Tax=Endozoicomonas lisbonensis TaxID=3120522 RepID=A0ABV2SN41_9GAMM
MAEQLDSYDLRLLDTLQTEATRSLAEVAEKVRLSASQCSRRINRLKEQGYIRSQVTLLNPQALGLDVEAFITIQLEKHDEQTTRHFNNAVNTLDAILECHAITGDGDYLLRVIAPNRQALTDFLMNELMTLPGVCQVKTALALSSIKSSTRLPIA